ncbi:MAG: hypothetical protein U1F34_02365 [Gammaproteobacteria bacterium]
MRTLVRNLFKLRVVLLVTPLLLSGCAGIPLSTMVRMARFDPKTLLSLDPAEFLVAINTDARVQSIASAPTTFELKITPRDPALWSPLERSVAMQAIAVSSDLGLAPAPVGRRWLVFGFDAGAGAELRAIQQHFRSLQQRESGGGSIGLGIGQQWLAQNYSTLRDQEVETWLRLDAHEGFFKLWHGHIRDLERVKSNATTQR